MRLFIISIILLLSGCATTMCDRGDFLVKAGYDHVHYCENGEWYYLGCNDCKIGNKNEQ